MLKKNCHSSYKKEKDITYINKIHQLFVDLENNNKKLKPKGACECLEWLLFCKVPSTT